MEARPNCMHSAQISALRKLCLVVLFVHEGLIGIARSCEWGIPTKKHAVVLVIQIVS